MKELEKQLKKQAESILPVDAKTQILSRVSSESKEKKAKPTTARRAQRRYVYSAIAAVLVVCIGLGFGLGFGLKGEGGTSDAPVVSDTYIALSINPSFGITASADGTVKEVTALNEDAVLVLYGVDFDGKQIDETAETLVALSAELGYLADGGEAEFVVCNSNAEVAKSIENAINAKINENEVLSSLNVSINFDLGGLSSLEQKASELLSGVNLDGLGAEEINKLLNGFDEEKLKNYAKSIDEEFSSMLDMIVETAYELSLAIEECKASGNYFTLFSAVANAKDCVKIFLAYIGVEDTEDWITAFIDELGSGNLQVALDFMYDLCDGNGEFDFDIELLLKAEIKADKIN